jgi:hypothetical protein
MQTQNSELIKELQGSTKIQTMSGLPTILSSNIVPTIEINPKIVKNGSNISQSLANATSSGFTFTAPTDRDMYITGANLTFVRDATATSTKFAVTYVNDLGATITLLSFGGVTLNAGSGSTQTPAMHPIKIQRGSTMTITSTSATGNFSINAQIYYFIDDCSNAS